MNRQIELHHFSVRLADCPKATIPEFSFSGRSNVGKSRLINYLLRRKKLAHISGKPGKTKTFVYYRIDDRFNLVDMPGYGYAKISPQERKRWLAAAVEYLRGREQLRGVLQLIDLGVGPTPNDLERVRLLRELDRPFCLVFTKADKVKKSEREPRLLDALGRLEAPEEAGVVLSSAVKKLGAREIWAWLDDQLALPSAAGPR
jgi:GTP-binding protein